MPKAKENSTLPGVSNSQRPNIPATLLCPFGATCKPANLDSESLFPALILSSTLLQSQSRHPNQHIRTENLTNQHQQPEPPSSHLAQSPAATSELQAPRLHQHQQHPVSHNDMRHRLARHSNRDASTMQNKQVLDFMVRDLGSVEPFT